MDIAKLLLEYLKVLIWPLLILYAIYIIRPYLDDVLPRLKNAKIPGGFSIDLSEDIREVKELSHEIPRSIPPAGKENLKRLDKDEVNTRMISLGLEPSPSGLNTEKYRDLAKEDPNLALAGLRIELETLGRNIAKGFKVDIKSQRSATDIYKKLYDEGALTRDQYELIRKVLKVSNSAVHGAMISTEEALDVIDVGDVLARQYVDWLNWGFD